MSIVGSISDDGEPYFQYLLAQLAESNVWKQVVGTDPKSGLAIPCPLSYSKQELSTQKQELAKWERSVERKAGVIAAVGAYTGWDGAVALDEYYIIKERLKQAKKDFLDKESRNRKERAQWESVWPFQDG